MITVNKIESASELNKAFEIRKKVFVVEQNVPEEEEYDEFEKSSTHFIAFLNEKPVGTCRWRNTDKGIKLERFAVLAEVRGKGVGDALLEACLDDIKPIRKDKIVYLHAQEHAIPFYQKSGFFTFGERFFECEIPHYKMML